MHCANPRALQREEVNHGSMGVREHEKDIVYRPTLYMHVGLMDLEMCVAKIAEHN